MSLSLFNSDSTLKMRISFFSASMLDNGTLLCLAHWYTLKWIDYSYSNKKRKGSFLLLPPVSWQTCENVTKQLLPYLPWPASSTCTLCQNHGEQGQQEAIRLPARLIKLFLSTVIDPQATATKSFAPPIQTTSQQRQTHSRDWIKLEPPTPPFPSVSSL